MQEYKIRCPECNSKNLYHSKDSINCKDCGLVLEDNLIDFGQDWRSFDNQTEDKQRRTGAPMKWSQHDQGLSTEVGTKSDLNVLGKIGRAHV